MSRLSQSCWVVPSTAAAFPCCIAIESLGRNYWWARGSPDFLNLPAQLSEKKSCTSGPKTPVFSMARGTKWWVVASSTYVIFFLASACSATVPASLVAKSQWEGHRCQGRLCPRPGSFHFSMVGLKLHRVSSHLQVCCDLRRPQ